MSEKIKFDYIVVGGGTAGTVIASRLNEYLPDASIALVEVGPDASSEPDLDNPLAIIGLLQKGLILDYSTEPQEHLDNRRVFNPGGRLLSGSSAVNMGVWLRPSSTDFEVIAQKAGHERFKLDNMLPYFKKSETWWDQDVDARFHGFDGPVHTVGGRKYPLREDLRRSFEKLGYEYNPDATAGDPTGLSELVQSFRAMSASSSIRQHSSRVYNLSRVHVLTDSPVSRILLDESKKAVGVKLGNKNLMARKEVIVSCGSQKSPQLLMLSGIGPASDLQRRGIPIRVDSPQVGRNLFDHLGLVIYMKLKHPEKGLAFPFNASTTKAEYGQGLPWEWHAFANIPPKELSAYLNEDKEPGIDDSTHPHLQERRCHTMNIPHYLPIMSAPTYSPDINMDGAHIALTALNMLPTSRGVVSLASADPKDEPIADPKYMSTSTDRFMLRYAVRKNLALAETSPFAEHIACETPPIGFQALTSKSSDEEIDARIRAFSQAIAHPMGTCALGTVLDDEFKVKGVSGLRVCDASVFPEPIGGMPQATVYALGELCADLIAGGDKRVS